MNVVLRKISHIPSRLRSTSKEIRHVIDGLIEASRGALLISRRLRNMHLEGEQVQGVAVVNAGRCLRVTDIELYLAHILASNGFTVYVLFDDGVLEHWDSNQTHRLKYYSPYRAHWSVRWRSEIRKRLMCVAYKKGNYRILNYSSIVSRNPIDESVEETDIEHATSSTKRFFMTGAVDVNGAHRDYFHKSLRNCAISRSVASYVRDVLRPDLYVTSHCIYSVWGPAYAKIKEAGIPVLVYHVVGNTTGKIRLTDQYIQRLSQSTDWQEFDDQTPLASEKVRQGGDVLNERIGHLAYDLREYYPDGADDESLRRLNIPQRGKTFAMFPNVVWDGDLSERNIIFGNVIEWCTFTIEAFRSLPHHLCIRFHPAEDTRHEGSTKLEQILRERIGDLDSISNLTLIGSGVKLDTYKFAQERIDVGLIYDGTLCLELTYLGIPVVACTNGLFTLDSVAYKPQSLDAYREYLTNPDPLLERFARERDERRASACKYAYWLFRESLLEFKPLEKPYPAEMNYNLVRKDESLSSDEQRISDRLMRALR